MIVNIDKDLCTGCQECVKVCPVSAITGEPHKPQEIDADKCVICGQCVQVCKSYASIIDHGEEFVTNKKQERKIPDVINEPLFAANNVCDIDKVKAALKDPSKITMVQCAPAVRVALGEDFGMELGSLTSGKMAAALKALNFDKIYDTNFAADLTIMEEGHEFIHRFTHKDRYKLPMFTSCCPGWIRTIKARYPEMVGQLSTAKSPQQMFGAVAKSYYAKLLGVDADQIFSVSIMPCLAKKSEAALPTMNDAGSGQDVDLVLTTREIDRMIRIEQINPNELEEEEFDMPLGVGSGAGVIFGATGGVMEAALRSAYFMMTGENPDPDAFKEIRGMDGWKEAKFEIKGMPIKVAIASGLGNTQKLMDAIKKGKVNYDFVEIMACPGGCAGGGGQPIVEGEELAGIRGEALYGLDKVSEIRFSHENPAVKKLYSDYLGSPGTEAAHKLLHTNHKAWDMPSN